MTRLNLLGPRDPKRIGRAECEAWGLGKTFLKFIVVVKRAETFALSKKTPAMLQSDTLVPAEDNLRRFSLIYDVRSQC